MQNTFIYLVGFPGTGKYTIAKEIVKKAGFRLVDNHLINNPVFTLIHADGKTPLPAGVWNNVGKIWDAVLDTLAHLSPPDYSFVLTNHLAEGDDGDRRHYERIESVAKHRHAHFVPVRLVISNVDEHVKRITSADRSSRHKETNPASPQKYSETKEILRIDHPHALTLDVTALNAAEAADAILAHALKQS